MGIRAWGQSYSGDNLYTIAVDMKNISLSSAPPTSPGIPPGTVVVTDKAFNAFLEQEHQTVSDTAAADNESSYLIQGYHSPVCIYYKYDM